MATKKAIVKLLGSLELFRLLALYENGTKSEKDVVQELKKSFPKSCDSEALDALSAHYAQFVKEMSELKAFFNSSFNPPPSSQHNLRDVYDRLARILECPLSGIIILGERGAGKSTICNALVEGDFAPVLPAETDDFLHYSYSESPEFECDGKTIPLPANLDAAANVVREFMKRKPCGTSKRVVRVRHLFKALKYGIELIDSPGINANFDRTSIVTRESGRAAALIAVSDAAAKGLTEQLKASIESIQSRLWREFRTNPTIVHVITRTDLISHRAETMSKFINSVAPDICCSVNGKLLRQQLDADDMATFQSLTGSDFHSHLDRLLGTLVPVFRASLAAQRELTCLRLEYLADNLVQNARSNLFALVHGRVPTAEKLRNLRAELDKDRAAVIKKLRSDMESPESSPWTVLPKMEQQLAEAVLWHLGRTFYKSTFIQVSHTMLSLEDVIDWIRKCRHPLRVVGRFFGSTFYALGTEVVIMFLDAILSRLDEMLTLQLKMMEAPVSCDGLQSVVDQAEKTRAMLHQVTMLRFTRFSLNATELPELDQIKRNFQHCQDPAPTTLIVQGKRLNAIVRCIPFDKCLSLLQEESQLRVLNHRHIVGYHGYHLDLAAAMLLFVIQGHGNSLAADADTTASILQFIETAGIQFSPVFTEDGLYELALQLLFALEYLHSRDMTHGAVISTNILRVCNESASSESKDLKSAVDQSSWKYGVWQLSLPRLEHSRKYVQFSPSPGSDIQELGMMLRKMLQLTQSVEAAQRILSESQLKNATHWQRLEGFISVCNNAKPPSASILLTWLLAAENPSHWPTRPDSAGSLRVLAIDGGGVKGISALVILAALEKTAQKPIYELFDLVVGTSIGSIIAGGLIAARLPAKDLCNFFHDIAFKMFQRSNPTIEYDPEPLRKSILDILGSVRLDTMAVRRDIYPCRLGVVSKAVSTSGPFVFRGYTTLRSAFAGTSDAAIVDAIMASSAARSTFPTHIVPGGSTFPTHIVPGGSTFPTHIVPGLDGGVGYNNPSEIAYSEALSISGQPPRIMVSIGCGQYPSEKFGVSMIPSLPTLHRCCDQVSLDTHIRLSERCSESRVPYHRLSAMFGTHVSLEDTKIDTMSLLESATQDYVNTESFASEVAEVVRNCQAAPDYKVHTHH